MTAFVFPGQGAQFEGMGLDLYESSESAKAIFMEADTILGFELSKIMFYGSAEELKQTKVTQPALFVHAIATLKARGEHVPDAVAGHSLGEFSALVANGTLSFADGLKLVYARAMAMQAACEAVPGTMAAILGLENEVVENICASIDEVVVAANYNCPGQLVISGSNRGIEIACELMKAAGAKRALPLPVPCHPRVLRHRPVHDQQQQLGHLHGHPVRCHRLHILQARLRAGAADPGLHPRADDGREPAPCAAAVAR